MPRETTLRHDGAHAQQGNRGQRRAPRHITRLVASLMDRDRGSQTRIAELLGVDRSTGTSRAPIMHERRVRVMEAA